MSDIPEAYIYDAIRTPRGRARPPVPARGQADSLVVGLIDELRKRNPERWTRPSSTTWRSASSPRSATRAVTSPPPPSPRACRTPSRECSQPVLRVRVGGGEHRRAEGALRDGGWHRRRREAMSWVPMGSDGGVPGDGPGDRLRDRLRAAGHRRRPDATLEGFSCLTSTRSPSSRRPGPSCLNGVLPPALGGPGRDQWLAYLDRDSTSGPVPP
ncbi:hypothetical protein HBB16_03075 [Pseudonocardia sp. MCCB 268]|nr:hypothetical protein [Pseudonocardia cytotoxica]